MIETSKARCTLYLWRVGQTAREKIFAASGKNLSGCIYVSSYDDNGQNEPSYIIQAFVERMYGVLELQYEHINLELK